jgi:hypothetical protein
LFAWTRWSLRSACPVPHAGSITEAPAADEPVEVVHCRGCGKLLRRRPRLTERQHAEALALRWAAEQLESDSTVVMVQRRRKFRGTPDEDVARAMIAAADRLRGWARTVHKRPALRESGPEQTSTASY